VSGTVDVEVLVVSYNSAETLRTCLESVQRAAPGTPIAIREHGSDPDAARVLSGVAASHPAPVRIERDASNPGFGAGCNALARTSSAAFLLFLNPDAEVLDWPWSPTEPPPRRTIWGPRMVGSGHPGDHSGVHYHVRNEIARSWLRRRGPRPDGTGFVSGAALLVDRESFESVGGFDEQYFLFYEDIDLCLRANQQGIATRIDERWTVRHRGAHSTRREFGRALEWSYESAVRFHGRRGDNVVGYRVYVVADASLRAVAALLQRRRSDAAAYGSLTRRAASDLLHREPPSP
jgi:GT2 family glycosyltransferase